MTRTRSFKKSCDILEPVKVLNFQVSGLGLLMVLEDLGVIPFLEILISNGNLDRMMVDGSSFQN